MADMLRNNKLPYFLSVLTAATLWGFMGLFRRVLGNAGVESAGMIVLRCGTAAMLFLVTVLLRNPSALKVRLKDLWCFLGTGICSMLFFTYCYFRAIELMSLSVSAILLYTAPVFVVLLSAVLFDEPLGRKKLIAVGVAFVGCCFVSGIGQGTAVTAVGVLFGLGAGIGYALYSIFAKFAIDRGYNNLTINLYTHGFAATGATLLWGAKDPLMIAVSSSELMAWTLAMGALTCFIPYLLYTYSLRGLEAGKASVYANVEPVVATLVGVTVFHEILTVGAILGMVLILSAVLMLNKESNKNAQ